MFKRLAQLIQLEELHLEWQEITHIDNLDLFTGLKELYLQHVRPSLKAGFKSG